MFKSLNSHFQSRFIRSIFIVATGTAGAQAITMAFAPLITRLYGPEAFGLLGAFMAILTVLTPMAALTYPIGIVLPKLDADARGLAQLSVLLGILTSALVMVFLHLYGNWFAVRLGVGAISPYLWLIPLAMLFSALHQVLEQWLIRNQEYRVTAGVSVIQSFILNSAKAIAGLNMPFASVLIVMQTLHSALYAILLWIGMRKKEIQISAPLNKSKLWKLAGKHKDFPLYRAPEVAIYAASASLPVLMLASFFGPAAAGFYTLAHTVMGIPSSLIGKSVGDVLYPRICEAANNRVPLYPLIFRATLLLGTVGLLPFVIVVAFGPSIFSFVFGGQWETAGEYARWLSFWMFFLFLNIPSIKLLPVIDAQEFQLKYTLMTLAISSAGLFVAYKIFSNEISVVMVFGVLGAIINIVLISIVFFKCKNHDISMQLAD